MEKVLIAMSGGVDSSVAAALLQKQGYFTAGAYMKNFSAESWQGIIDAVCPWEQDVADAQAVCKKLGIEFRSINFERDYCEKVIDYFFDEYAAGRTPNPDVMCNKEIKFGLFLEKALDLGFDYIATGHYARIRNSPPSPSLISARGGSSLGGKEGVKGEFYELLKGVDPKKDQSYFLYTLTQDQLQHTLFPIGEYTKQQVRQMAKDFGLPNWNKKDSQGICFVGHIKLREFLKQRLPERVGDIVDPAGRVIGQHPGAWYYTIGQRHGLALGGGTPYYVAAKDTIKNKIVVASKPLLSKLVEDREVMVKNLNWINPLSISPSPSASGGAEGGENKKKNFSPMRRGRGRGGSSEFSCAAKIRYQQPDQRCAISPLPGRERGRVRVKFDYPQFALAPGQSIVFYDADRVLGGGIIENCANN